MADPEKIHKSDLDRTYQALVRTPFNQVVDMCYKADPNGTYTFNKLNGKGTWRVARSFEYIVIGQGWKVEDFNEQLEKELNDKE